jgi:hypothetical protein
MAAETTTQPVSRDILEDRYTGLLTANRTVVRAGEELQTVGDYNDLQLKLDNMIDRLVEGIARAPVPDQSNINGALQTHLRTLLITLVEEEGFAR